MDFKQNIAAIESKYFCILVFFIYKSYSVGYFFRRGGAR